MIKIVTYEAGNSFYRMNQNNVEEFNPIESAPGKTWGNSIYFFVNPDDLKQYDDSDHQYPIVVQNNQPLKCIISYGRNFGENDIKELVEEIKNRANINTAPDDRKGFMTWLGENGFAFQCYHDDNSMELIIPIALLRNRSWEISPFSIFPKIL